MKNACSTAQMIILRTEDLTPLQLMNNVDGSFFRFVELVAYIMKVTSTDEILCDDDFTAWLLNEEKLTVGFNSSI